MLCYDFQNPKSIPDKFLLKFIVWLLDFYAKT